MLNLTLEEKKVILFLLAVAFCGILLHGLTKLNFRAQQLYAPAANLAQLDLNGISLEALLESRALPEKTARSIIAYRQEHGNFGSLETLKEIKGIGEKRYQQLQGLFFVK